MGLHEIVVPHGDGPNPDRFPERGNGASTGLKEL